MPRSRPLTEDIIVRLKTLSTNVQVTPVTHLTLCNVCHKYREIICPDPEGTLQLGVIHPSVMLHGGGGPSVVASAGFSDRERTRESTGAAAR